MKTLKFFLPVLLALTLLIVAVPALAQALPELIPCTDDCTFQHLLQLVKNIINFIVAIAVPLASVVIMYAGIKLVLSRTNETERSEAKKVLWTAVWGLVIVLAAWLIVNTILVALLREDFDNPLTRVILKYLA